MPKPVLKIYDDNGVEIPIPAIVGKRGPTGPAGPNSVSTSTDSSITGLLKGDAGKVAQAIAGVDYLATESDPQFLSAASASAHYTGFPNRTDTALSFSGVTFTLTATSDIVWVNGVAYTINTLTKALTSGQQAVSGIYWFWITAPAGVPQLNCDVNPPGFDKCLVATVYWNATTAKGIVSDERHWMGRDQMWHANVHMTQGARYASGMAGTFGNTSISIEAGTFYDEDIPHSWTSPLTTVRVLYHDGSSAWKWDVLTTPYKVVNPGVDSNLRFNNGTALATAQNNRYVNYWVYASGDAEYPINVILGTAEYTTLTAARAATPPSFGALISAEAKLIYRLTYQNNGGTPAYNSATDYRVTASSGTAYVPTDHSALTGLTNLDHPASAIRNTPSTYVSATNVQAAIDEVGNEIGDAAAVLAAINGDGVVVPTETLIANHNTSSAAHSTLARKTEAMRLLISRTIGAGENVSAITWTQDDAGNALSLIEAEIRVNVPSNTIAVGTTGLIFARFNDNSATGDYVSTGARATSMNVGVFRSTYGRSVVELKRIAGYYIGSINYTYYDGTTFASYALVSATNFTVSSISKIYISMTASGLTYLPDGATIEIYGRTA